MFIRHRHHRAQILIGPWGAGERAAHPNSWGGSWNSFHCLSFASNSSSTNSPKFIGSTPWPPTFLHYLKYDDKIPVLKKRKKETIPQNLATEFGAPIGRKNKESFFPSKFGDLLWKWLHPFVASKGPSQQGRLFFTNKTKERIFSEPPDPFFHSSFCQWSQRGVYPRNFNLNTLHLHITNSFSYMMMCLSQREK